MVWAALSIKLHKDSTPPPQERFHVDLNRPMQISGLRYSNYYDDNLESRLEFDNFQVRPRRFGPFKIQSVNEIFIRNARIQRLPVAQKEEKQEEEKDSISNQLPASLKEFLKSQKIGRVQRVVFEGLQYTRIDSHAEGITSKIMARHAEYDFRQKKLILTNAALNNYAVTRHLIAKEIEWNESKRAWWVSGAATLREENNPSKTLKKVWLNESLEQIELGPQ